MTGPESDQFDSIVQQDSDAMFVLDADERIVDANDQACLSLGCDCSGESTDCPELIGSHWSEFWMSTGDSHQKDARLAALRESSEAVITVEGRHERIDGSTFPIRVRAARIDHDGAGEFLAIARDLSNVFDQQRQLRRQKARLDQFASVISHDLRSPLSVARAGVEVARRTEELEGDSLERVSRAHDRMETLVDDLLTLARSGGQMEATDIEPVELSTVVTRSWNTVSTEGAELCVEDDLTFLADESRLRQLVENLFRNGVEHGSTGNRTQSDDSVKHGSTSSRTQSDDSVKHGSTSSRTQSGDSVEHGSTGSQPQTTGSVDAAVTIRVGTLTDGFYIEDDGPGIPEADREAVFEPGYTTETEGTGYGLEIVRTVAEAHDWTVTITDSAGGGARFELSGVDAVEPTA